MNIPVRGRRLTGMLDALNEKLPDTLAYEGCSEVNVCTNLDEGPDKIEVLSKWETKAHYDKYLNWRIETGALEAMSVFFAGEPVFRFLDVYQTY